MSVKYQLPDGSTTRNRDLYYVTWRSFARTTCEGLGGELESFGLGRIGIVVDGVTYHVPMAVVELINRVKP
jgi:hypothetical protein